jgi:hypothetical protein
MTTSISISVKPPGAMDLAVLDRMVLIGIRGMYSSPRRKRFGTGDTLG